LLLAADETRKGWVPAVAPVLREDACFVLAAAEEDGDEYPRSAAAEEDEEAENRLAWPGDMTSEFRVSTSTEREK